MDRIVQDFDVHLDNDDFVQDTQISPHFLQNLKEISNGKESGDDLSLDDYMTQQEHGARSK